MFGEGFNFRIVNHQNSWLLRECHGDTAVQISWPLAPSWLIHIFLAGRRSHDEENLAEWTGMCPVAKTARRRVARTAPGDLEDVGWSGGRRATSSEPEN